MKRNKVLSALLVLLLFLPSLSFGADGEDSALTDGGTRVMTEDEVTSLKINEEMKELEERNDAKMEIGKLLYENSASNSVLAERLNEFENSLVVYDFIPYKTYIIICSKGHQTDIRLESGEELTASPFVGDGANWMFTKAISIEDGVVVPHLFVQPLDVSKITTATLTTNRRTYYLKLFSIDTTTYMVGVKFNYPHQSSDAIRLNGTDGSLSFYNPSSSPASLDFSYKIEGSLKQAPKWKPVAVYSDGVRTYFKFSSSFENGIDEPALYFQRNLSDDGDLRLVNSRPKGDVLVTDMTIDGTSAFLLVLDNDRIRITRR